MDAPTTTPHVPRFPFPFEPMPYPLPPGVSFGSEILPPPADVTDIFGPPVPPTYKDIPYVTPPPTTTTTTEPTYSPPFSASQKLDIHLPEGQGPFPAILFVHGGAFLFGDKALFQKSPELKILKHGYALISINYRLGLEARFPAAIEDVKAAVRFLRAEGETFNLKTSVTRDGGKVITKDPIGAWGGSAGGNLVALLGTSKHHVEFDNPLLGNMEYPSEVDAVVDWYGPTDFGLMDEMLDQLSLPNGMHQPHDHHDSPESLYLGGPLKEVPDLVKAANPMTYVTKDCPPFYIVHGRYDSLVPCLQSYILYRRIVKVAGKDRASMKFVNSWHVDFEAENGPYSGDAAIKDVANFFDKHIK